METLEIHGTQIPLLEAPRGNNEAPRRILYVLFKHKLFIAAMFVVLSLPAILFYLAQPQQYVATAKVMVQPSRAFLNPGPDGGQLSVSPSPENINNEIEIVKSRELLERLVQDVPLHQERSGNNQNGNSQVQPGEPDTKVDAARIGGRLKVIPLRISNIIQIRLTSTNPEWAVQVVNRAAELHQAQHVEVHKTRGIAEFYDQQEKTLQTELAKAETALKEFQVRENVVDAERELGSTLGRAESFETTLKTTESSIREASERIRILEAQVKEQRENVSAGRTEPNSPVVGRIRERLVQLELDRNSLLQRYTEKDRAVQDKEKEIVELKGRLKAELRNVMGGEAVSLNGIHDGVLNSLLAARAELNALQAKRSVLATQVAGLSSQAAELKNKGYGYDRLLRDLNAKKEVLALYIRKAEEARISNAMDERKFGNIAIVEKASLPLQPSGYNPLMMVFLMVFGALGISVASAFAVEFFNTTLRSEADVEEQLGLPVLATIQYYGN